MSNADQRPIINKGLINQGATTLISNANGTKISLPAFLLLTLPPSSPSTLTTIPPLTPQPTKPPC